MNGIIYRSNRLPREVVESISGSVHKTCGHGTRGHGLVMSMVAVDNSRTQQS